MSGALLTIVIVALAFFIAGRPAVPVPAPASAPAPVADVEPANYVGRKTCSGCHATQTTAWQESQHAQAMEHAVATTVLGNFDNARFSYAGVTSTFSRRGDEFWVRTDGPDGKLTDFKISYTFGIYPLQQYLIAFPDGRMQALSIAWDARPEKDGGQRWFHLYPGEHIDYQDELHWTRDQQNWNYMCADCHSTNLRRNYDADQNTFATTWSDLDVACESCHGPGSTHVAWAQAGKDAKPVPNMGLSIPLDARHGVTWVADTTTGNASRSTPLLDHREIQTCAVCHSRRRSISTNPGPTGQLLDTHNPALLTEGLYFADGQQEDEVYTYGSFLQSKMYAKGVSCSDCHDPHTAKLRVPGNVLCAQCHLPTKYAVVEHTRHTPDSAGAQCVNCHMPTRNYMVIDPRRDHSLRIPRPDLSVALGTPNACNSCHTDRKPEWAAAAIEGWFAPDRKGFQTWGPTFDAARKGQAMTIQKLARLFANPETPGIVQATALAEMRRFPGRLLFAAINDGLKNDDPLVRIAALDALTDFPPLVRDKALPAADDDLLAVRAAAGRTLAPVDLQSLSPGQRAMVEQGFKAYESTQSAVAERPEAHLNLGLFHTDRQDATRAEAEYLLAIKRDPQFVPAYVNLADVYRATNRSGDAERTLDEGLVAAPEDPTLLHALGLTRIRQSRHAEALVLFAHAHELAPENMRFAYVYAVALRSSGKSKQALRTLDQALVVNPNAPDLLYARASYALEDGDTAAAQEYANRFVSVAPEDPRAVPLLQQAGTGSR
ncbi:MAG: multiheme c-type cytochrome [Gammaproteobacteria bacterium]